MKYLFYLATFIFIAVSPIQLNVGLVFNNSVQQEINVQQNDANYVDFQDSEEVDSDQGEHFFFLILGLIFVLVFVVLGITLTAALLFILFGFIAAGILSTSVLIALNRKSFSKGFKTFVVLTATLSGLTIGAVGFWFLNLITHWWDYKIALLTGAISGLVAGISFGYLAFYAIRKITTNLKARLRLNK